MRYDKPCAPCAKGEHEKCLEGICGCIEDHENDDPIMRGFKIIKRALVISREP